MRGVGEKDCPNGEKIKKFKKKKLNIKDRSSRNYEALQHINIETTQAIDELRVKKMESDKAAQLYKIRLHDLELRMLKVEETLAKALNVNLANLVGAMDKSAASAKKEENPTVPDFVENGKVKADAGDGDATSPEIYLISENSGGSGGIGLSKKGSFLVVSHILFSPTI